MNYENADECNRRPFLVKVSKIVWDTDGEKIPALPSSKELVIEAESGEEAADVAIDRLSDTFGWCILSSVAEATDCLPA